RMFQIAGSLQVQDFTNKGNIHGDTFLITATEDGTCREYLLQRINHHVFTRPRSVMAAMMACTDAQREYLERHPLSEGDNGEVIHLAPTATEDSHLELPAGEETAYWRMMERIQETQTYQSLSELPGEEERLWMAEQAGKGLAMYGDLTS